MAIFAVGGGAGVGKTTAARALSASLGAGWLQLDTIWLTLIEGAEPGSARHDALDVRAAVRSAAVAGRADPDELLVRMIAAARLVEEVLPQVLAFESAAHRHLVVDGSWLTPTGVARIAADLPMLRAEAGLPWDGYQVVAEGVSEPGAAGDATAREWVDAGATYWVESDWSMGADAVDRHRRRIEAGPPRP